MHIKQEVTVDLAKRIRTFSWIIYNNYDRLLAQLGPGEYNWHAINNGTEIQYTDFSLDRDYKENAYITRLVDPDKIILTVRVGVTEAEWNIFIYEDEANDYIEDKMTHDIRSKLGPLQIVQILRSLATETLLLK